MVDLLLFVVQPMGKSMQHGLQLVVLLQLLKQQLQVEVAHVVRLGRGSAMVVAASAGALKAHYCDLQHFAAAAQLSGTIRIQMASLQAQKQQDARMAHALLVIRGLVYRKRKVESLVLGCQQGSCLQLQVALQSVLLDRQACNP
jgi:hypothetical protein